MGAFGMRRAWLTIPLIAPMVKRLDCRRTMIRGCVMLAVSALGFTAIDSAGVLAAVLRGAQGIAWSLTFAAGHVAGRRGRAAVRLGHGIGLYGAAALATARSDPAVAEPIAAQLRRAAAVHAVGGRRVRRARGTAGVSRRRAAAPAVDRKPPPGESGTARSRVVVIGVLAVGSLGPGGGLHVRGAVRADPRDRGRARLPRRLYADGAGDARRRHAPGRQAGPAQRRPSRARPATAWS